MLRTTASAEQIDPKSAEGTIKLNRKLRRSTKDGEETTYRWWGTAYSRIPGQRDRKLFKLEDMNVRQCVEIKDKKFGVGYRMVSRELMLYLDPETGEILRKWVNPWTSKKDDIIHVANDPVNGRPDFGIDKMARKRVLASKF